MLTRMFAFFYSIVAYLLVLLNSTKAQVKQVQNSDIVSKKLPHMCSQALIGSKQILATPFEIVINLPFAKSRELTRQLFVQNILLYMVPVLLVEKIVKPTINDYLIEENSTTDILINTAINIAWARIFSRMFIYNTAYNLCAPDVIPEELINETKIQGCECEDSLKVKAALSSPFHYLGNISYIALLSNIPVLGTAINITTKPLVYGQTLVEYKLSEAGMCEKHKVEFLSKHNSYCFGLGATAFLLTGSCNMLVYLTTGVSNFFIQDAIFSAFYPHFITLIKKEGISKQIRDEVYIDFFKYNRLIVNDILKSANSWLSYRLEHPELRGKLIQRAKNIACHPVSQAIAKIALGDDLRKLDTLVTTPAIKYYLKLKYPSYMSALNTMLEVRQWKKFLFLSNYISPYLPTFVTTDSTKVLLKILQREGIEQLLHNLKRLLHKSQYETQNPAIVKMSARRIAEHLIENYYANNNIEVSIHSQKVLEEQMMNSFTMIYSEVPTPPITRMRRESLKRQQAKAKFDIKEQYKVIETKPKLRDNGIVL